MTSERTEDLGITRVLPLTVGGQRVELRVLTIAESDVWQSLLARTLARLDILDQPDNGEEMLAQLFRVGNEARLDVLLAYDLDGTLGGRDAVRQRMTKHELAAALEAMVEAEGPLGVAESRSVVEAFGRPMQYAAATLALMQALSQQASSTNGLSPIGESDTTTSDSTGATNNSSSDGPTDTGASSASRKNGSSRQKRASTTATCAPARRATPRRATLSSAGRSGATGFPGVQGS